MSHAREGSVLLGALLERIGAAQSQALLSRIDRWLASAAHPDTKGFDQDQVRAVRARTFGAGKTGTEITLDTQIRRRSTPKDRES